MPLFTRDGKWWARGYYWDAEQQRRRRWRRSTGVADDGTARTKRIAEQVAAEIGTSYAAGTVRRARPLTLKAAIAIHVAAHERAGSRDATIEIVNYKAARLMAFFGPEYDVNGLTDTSLVEYADSRRLQPGRVKDGFVTSGTIHRELRTLREALKDAIREKRWEGAVPAMPKLGVIYKPREVWLDKTQSQRVLLALPPERRDHFIIYRQLGIDRGELYRIEPKDIDWKRNEVRVRGTKTAARDRIMPITPEVREVLFARRNDSPMFAKWHNALRDLALACKKAGVHTVNFKDLRRSFATELARAGVPVLHLKDLMGHSTTRMLEKVYARVAQGAHMHKAMESVSELRPRANNVPQTAKVAAGADSVVPEKTLDFPEK